MNLAALSDNALTQHLDELQIQLQSFLLTLEQEHQILQTNNPNLLLELMPVKQQQADKITLLLENLVATFQLPANLNELKQLAKDAAQPGLVTKIDELLALSENCKDLNMQNGLTIMAIENINNEMINIFSQPNEASVSLYDSRGGKNQAKSNLVLGKA